MMKFRKVILTLLLCLVACNVLAKVHVKGYYRKNGTYVRPHYRTAPDGITWNNYSARGISKVHNSCASHSGNLTEQAHKALHSAVEPHLPPDPEQHEKMLKRAKFYWEHIQQQ